MRIFALQDAHLFSLIVAEIYSDVGEPISILSIFGLYRLFREWIGLHL